MLLFRDLVLSTISRAGLSSKGRGAMPNVNVLTSLTSLYPTPRGLSFKAGVCGLGGLRPRRLSPNFYMLNDFLNGFAGM